jgi:hypothetical protein
MEEIKVGVEVAAHVLVKSFRKKSQEKPPRKRGVLRYLYDVVVCSNDDSDAFLNENR